MTINDYFKKFVWLNPETGKKEWLPDVPDYIKAAARGFKNEVERQRMRDIKPIPKECEP